MHSSMKILNLTFENFPFYPIKSKLLGISTLVSYLNYCKWQGWLFFESHSLDYVFSYYKFFGGMYLQATLYKTDEPIDIFLAPFFLLFIPWEHSKEENGLNGLHILWPAVNDQYGY